MPRRRAVAVVAAVVATLALAAACADDPIPRPCSNIPAGGCPLSRGVACDDPECEAVYACLPGDVWELRQTCPPREGRARSDASAPPDAASPFDASFDAPPGAFGGPGCESLQAPDCMLGLALACGPDCCGCEELFVCEDRGWTLWGTCGDGGITPEP
ncbi:MAG: hypothetical protein KF782_04355 [Labilithrix sp.]|nr:hypothetical protein [Labilithrix sp.]